VVVKSAVIFRLHLVQLRGPAVDGCSMRLEPRGDCD
jgi:hypothetical protein